MRPIDLMRVIEAPLISEKTNAFSEKHQQVAFRVKKSATKIEIREAVEYLFHVEVESVNVLNTKGKQKRFGRTIGRHSDVKKAYVKLKDGFHIDFATA